MRLPPIGGKDLKPHGEGGDEHAGGDEAGDADPCESDHQARPIDHAIAANRRECADAHAAQRCDGEGCHADLERNGQLLADDVVHAHAGVGQAGPKIAMNDGVVWIPGEKFVPVIHVIFRLKRMPHLRGDVAIGAGKRIARRNPAQHERDEIDDRQDQRELEDAAGNESYHEVRNSNDEIPPAIAPPTPP